MAVRAFEARAIEPYEDGRAFGSAGPYEVVRGVVRHAVDPRTAAAQRVVDLEHAPMADDGTVRFDADVVVLRPVDATRGARTLVYSVANRGMVASLPMSSGAFAMPGASDRIEPGDGFLLERGLTVAWSGWQWDVSRGPGMVGLDAPEARAGDGGPLPGQVRMRLQPAADAPSVPLTGMALLPQPPPYRPLDPEDPNAVLTARERPEDDGWVVPRATWRFGRDDDGAFVVDPTALWVEGGLRGGLIYDVVYRPHRSPVVGAGLLAIRDTVSWLRWGSGDNPLAGRVDLVCATGASQSGRLLRQFLFDRMNADDDGRPVFDGVHVHIAGGRRGEFNVRFGQPGVIWRGVGDEPPWSTAALLDSQRAVGCAPKVLVTNSASEYWRGDAWLAHGDAETGRDLDDPAGVRHYLFSGVDHFGDLGELGALVPARNAAAGLDATVVERALFTALEAWVRDGVEPPPSRVPRIDDGTATERAPVLALLATREALATPDPDALPGVGPALVSEVDGDGNEVAGVRLPAVAAPVATYAGWNVRPPLSGLPSLVPDFVGSRVPLPDVGTRYRDRAAYERAARAAAEALAAQGYLLAADVDLAVAQAVAKFPLGRADTGVAGR